jgi:hypothetical protein
VPNLPDVPGKSLIGGMTKRARMVAAAAAGAALAAGGVVAKRVLGHGGTEDEGAKAEGVTVPDAATYTANRAVDEADDAVVTIAKEKAPSKLRTARPKAAKAAPKPQAAPKAAPKPKAGPKLKAAPKPAADKAKPPKTKAAPKPDSGKTKPQKPKAAPKPKAAKAAPSRSKTGPGDISVDREHPHRALSNPVGDPDETEYPDPYETRPDPRGPGDPDGAPFGEEPHPMVGAESTSEPPLEDDPEHPEGGRPPRRENLDQ